MKNKFKELKDNFLKFYSSPYGMLIVVSWAVLLLCLIIKLFGGNWFELWWENENFISFCNYVETKTWLKMVIACLIYCVSTYLIVCVILNKTKLENKLLLIYLPLMIIKSILNWYINIIPFIIDLFILLFIPIIYNKNWKRALFCFLGISLLQVVSIIIRNVSFNFNVSNTVIENTLIQIDYYIIIILCYLYIRKSKKGE